jgi:molecular chaperone GrpE
MIHARQSHAAGTGKEKEYLEGWQRSRAEFLNFRRRMHEQQSELEQRLLVKVIEPLLAIADNFQAMVQHVPKELKDNAWVTGVTHIARQVEQLLASYDVRPVGAVDQDFDPKQHEAIEHVAEDGKPPGKVVAVIKAGYALNSTIIRPAKVKVSR